MRFRGLRTLTDAPRVPQTRPLGATPGGLAKGKGPSGRTKRSPSPESPRGRGETYSPVGGAAAGRRPAFGAGSLAGFSVSPNTA